MKIKKKELEFIIGEYFTILNKMTKRILDPLYSKSNARIDFIDNVEYIAKLSFIINNVFEKKNPRQYQDLKNLIESFYTLADKFYEIMKENIIENYKKARNNETA